MTTHAPETRAALAAAETREALVALLVAHVERAYTTAGQPGLLEAVRDLFRRMEPAALAALAHELDLVAEPPAEAEPGGRP